MSTNLEKAMKLETNDYQKRDGEYPKSNIPDYIDIHKDTMTIAFKNTSEKSALAWARRKLEEREIKFNDITVEQTGDYHDDWVEVFVKLEVD